MYVLRFEYFWFIVGYVLKCFLGEKDMFYCCFCKIVGSFVLGIEEESLSRVYNFLLVGYLIVGILFFLLERGFLRVGVSKYWREF